MCKFAHHKVTNWTPANLKFAYHQLSLITMLHMCKFAHHKVTSWTPANLKLAYHQLPITMLQLCKFAHHKVTSWTPANLKFPYHQLPITMLHMWKLAYHKVTSWTPANLTSTLSRSYICENSHITKWLVENPQIWNLYITTTLHNVTYVQIRTSQSD